MKKIKAFTLIEIIIAMLLSSFTIGLAITFYLMMNNQFNRFTSRMDGNTRLVQFYKTLKQDVERADRAYYNSSTLELEKEESPGLTYLFSSKRIIRTHQTARDTFHLKHTNLNTKTVDDTELLQNLWFSVVIEGKPLVLSVKKQYPQYILYTEKQK